ncbi:hypothetical protein [Rhizobium sp. FKY42]|uniref:hypothetical protein n=1 Tax=Rhizobium sp. FKY42 TaxID=2562310 RepID=UPI0019826CE4|nr:hypothetical protein [Rhizobium sp. FKY42]
MSINSTRKPQTPPTGFIIGQGDAVTAWAMSPIRASYYPGEIALAEDRVNYRFINGFVDVGDLPCRVALWKEIKSRTVNLPDVIPVDDLYLPGFNRRVEFSGFWHRPTKLERWLKTRISASKEGSVPFRLATCGGVRIWVDGAEAVVFEPFKRNKESQTEITLPLKVTGSEVVVLCEELAERDALWYFELTSLGTEDLHVELPVDASDATISLLKDLATEVRPTPFHSKDGKVSLVFSHAPSVDVRLRASILPSVHMRDKPPLLDVTVDLKAGERMLALTSVDRLPDGYHPLDLTFSVGNVSVSRHIAFATMRDAARDMRDQSLAARKLAALTFAADHGEQRAGKAIAYLALGRKPDATFREIIANTIAAIDERRDCSDFVLVPLLWLAGAYRNQIPADLWEQIETSVLNYRYWVDEPGNDVMWFWSENHVLCFHVSQYLAGRLFNERRFACSGRTGDQQAALGEGRLLKWFDSVETHGLAEWNSAAYYPIDFIGLLALEHFGDGEIKRRSKLLLDRLFTMIALHTSGGVPAGSMGRAYDKELRAGPLTELAPFATVAFGQGFLNDGVAALTMFCAGTYEPPAHLSDYVEPKPGVAVLAHYVQGHDEAARLALYKTAHVQLSSMVDGKPGGRGHQQHVMDLRFAANPFARAWVNHPGEDDPWGSQRPSYWAGNGSMPRAAQYENASLMLYDLGDNPRIGFTHAYVEAAAFDQVELVDNWLILTSGKGIAALTATGTITPVTAGPGEGIEYRVAGNRCGWITIVGDVADETAREAFVSQLSDIRLSLGGSDLTLAVSLPGKPDLALSWNDGLQVAGKSYAFPNRTIDPLVRTETAFSF